MLHPKTPLLFAAAVLLSACAHGAGANQAARPDFAAPPAVGAGAAADEAPGPPPAIMVTGSHVPQRIDLTTGLPRTISPLAVHSRAQLDRTGVPHTGYALMMLTP